MNLFENAIQKNELLKFVLGKDEYFSLDREYGEHSVFNSWNENIISLFSQKGAKYVNDAIEKMFEEILYSTDIDEQTKNEILLYHLHVYYYLNSEHKIEASPLIKLNAKIEVSLNNYIQTLNEEKNPKEAAFVNAINLIKSRGGLKST